MDAVGLQNFILSGVPLMIQLYAEDYRSRDKKEALAELEGDLSLPQIAKYDYIIVGAGSAGCLLAERLSRSYSVLLLESGGKPVPATDNAFLINEVVSSTEISYEFATVPQLHFASGTNGISRIVNGKMLGGSGSHNACFYNRGSPRDYELFAELTKDPSFKYENMIKYFKRFENFRGWLVNETSWNDFGHSGQFVIEKALNPFYHQWFGAAKELGFDIADANPYQRVSFTALDKSEYNAVRSSSYKAFIKPIDGKRSNLRVLKYSTVYQILIKDGTAYGVTYKRHGIPQIAHASREVIISAGPIGSPMLLIKSGIGPLETLQSAGIQVHSALPAVGQNLKDHPELILIFKVNNEKEYAKYFPTTKEELQEELKKYQQPIPHKRGYIASMGGLQAFLASSIAKGEGEGGWPDLQIASLSGRINEDRTTVAMDVMGVRPKSTGQIGFNVAAYIEGEREDTKLALIDPNYFSDPRDLTAFIEGIRFAIKVMTETKSFSGLNLTFVDSSPSCRNFPQGSDPYWTCVIERDASTTWHLTSTNRMGAEDDPNSVVHSNFTVRGVARLRVVDSSVFPRITNSNTNGPSLVFAEKAAEVILQNPTPVNGRVRKF